MHSFTLLATRWSTSSANAVRVRARRANARRRPKKGSDRGGGAEDNPGSKHHGSALGSRDVHGLGDCDAEHAGKCSSRDSGEAGQDSKTNLELTTVREGLDVADRRAPILGVHGHCGFGSNSGGDPRELVPDGGGASRHLHQSDDGVGDLLEPLGREHSLHLHLALYAERSIRRPCGGGRFGLHRATRDLWWDAEIQQALLELRRRERWSDFRRSWVNHGQLHRALGDALHFFGEMRRSRNGVSEDMSARC